MSSGPVQIEFAPSHVVAPAVDADFAGVIRLDHNKPTGAITIHMRGIDKTMAAVKGLGPDIAAKAMPALALAKGLGKSESDGSLSWLVELDAERSIKVNGIPFGQQGARLSDQSSGPDPARIWRYNQRARPSGAKGDIASINANKTLLNASKIGGVY